ncbi:MAG: TPM domain-containing protein [Moraxella sp.]|nr:TPM domain-containing protein [Moraxella sp.]
MENITSTPSFSRWLRQLCFLPFHRRTRWLTSSAKQALSQRIFEAEQGHFGEIYLIIENKLPLDSAYRQGCRERALALFASHHVWDTQENTGILIYINLCEKDLEIIADRGINQKAQQDYWQALCQHTLTTFQAGDMQLGIEALIDELGALLRTHYPNHDCHGNELPNTPKHLK